MKIQSTAQYTYLYGHANTPYEHYEEDEFNVNPKQVFYYKYDETGVDPNVRIEIEKVPIYIRILYWHIKTGHERIETTKSYPRKIPARLHIHFTSEEVLHFAFKTNAQLKKVVKELEKGMK